MAPVEVHLTVEWVCSPGPGSQVQRLQLRLPSGSRVQDAMEAAGHVALPEGWGMAIWSRRVEVSEPLRDGDRVELLRPLTVDPMEARRRRHAHQKQPRPSRHRPLKV